MNLEQLFDGVNDKFTRRRELRARFDLAIGGAFELVAEEIAVLLLLLAPDIDEAFRRNEAGVAFVVPAAVEDQYACATL